MRRGSVWQQPAGQRVRCTGGRRMRGRPRETPRQMQSPSLLSSSGYACRAPVSELRHRLSSALASALAPFPLPWLQRKRSI